jgi:hypothetical protein
MHFSKERGRGFIRHYRQGANDVLAREGETTFRLQRAYAWKSSRYEQEWLELVFAKWNLHIYYAAIDFDVLGLGPQL